MPRDIACAFGQVARTCNRPQVIGCSGFESLWKDDSYDERSRDEIRCRVEGQGESPAEEVGDDSAECRAEGEHGRPRDGAEGVGGGEGSGRDEIGKGGLASRLGECRRGHLQKGQCEDEGRGLLG